MHYYYTILLTFYNMALYIRMLINSKKTSDNLKLPALTGNL